MTSPSANVTDVVFDFCGVLIDWQTRACLEGRYPQVVVDRICADNDPCGFYDYAVLGISFPGRPLAQTPSNPKASAALKSIP